MADLKQEKILTEFTIGGERYEVPPLSLYVLDVCQAEMNALGPELPFTTYAKYVIKIISVALENPEMDCEATYKVCSVPEMQGFIPAMSELLANSGFRQAATEENPGTGISNLSSPNSRQLEFLPETLTQ